MRRNAMRVALVNMPFGSTRYPSIQLGLLQAILRRRGFDAVTHYLNLHFAAQVGWELYETLCVESRHMLGEWLFARAAFGEEAPDSGRFLSTFTAELAPLCARLGLEADELVRLREQVAPEFIRECLDAVDWDSYDVVGFGSVFEQNCAALALARAIKERHPRVVTVFGGANFEDEMGLEYVRALPWIDYAVIGEGDEVFPALLDRLAAGDEVLDLPGTARREGAGVRFCGRAPMVRDLDALPDPEYDDYFTAAAELRLPAIVKRWKVQLPFETARGCWWGQKHHCTFCGLNGLGMAYRSKSPQRVLDSIENLAGRYHIDKLEAVDNILDHRYIAEVFGPLAERHMDYDLFYEVKANLTQAQLRALARGGVRRMQPGIESLSTHVLQLMRKGITAIQNVRLLKWATYYGITTPWNVITGFPGERTEDYERQLATMRLIPHLQPPVTVGRLSLERFSPYFTEAEQQGFREVRPEQSYACIYPPHLRHERIAYFFAYEAPNTLPDEAHTPLGEYVRWWKEAWRAPRIPYLYYLRGAGRLTVIDGRDVASPRVHAFDEPAALAYELCTPTQHAAPRVLAHLRDACGLDTDLGAVQHILEAFVVGGLMLEEDGHYLSLAVPANPNW